MGIETALIAGGSMLAGSLIGKSASDRAVNAQVQASNDANAEARREYDQTRQDQMPWMDAGRGALAQLVSGTQAGGQFTRPFTMADFHADPGYQFRMEQGANALERSAAARGGLLSGAAAKAMAKYGQDMGSQEYGAAYNRFNNDQTTQFNRLASLAGVGQTATNTVAQVGQNTSGQIQNNLIGAGNARASGYVGSANAINNGISQGMNWYQNNQLLSRLGGNSPGWIGYTPGPGSSTPLVLTSAMD